MPITRREFLKRVGVAAGGVGLAASGFTRLVPYVHQPDDINPGISNWYATSCRECPAGCGMVVRNRESRVLKCEGNLLHPIAHGTLCARGQAAPHGLYDPDRARSPLRRGESGKLVKSTWRDALRVVGSRLERGTRIAFVTDLQTGSLDALMRAWTAALGGGRVVVYEPIDYAPVKSAFGGVVPAFDIAASDYLVSCSADFLENWVSPIEYAGHFARMRQVRDGKRGRFIYIGPRVSMTAANADVRIIVPPGRVSEVASAILAGGHALDSVAGVLGLNRRELAAVSRGWAAARSPLALPGWDTDSARAAGALNGGGTPLVDMARPHALSNIDSRAAMTSLIRDMESGAVDVLVVYGANPVYGLPESARFTAALERVEMVVSLSSYIDETAEHAHWVLPSNTPLESWGDYSPYPDVSNLMQPAMGALFDTRHTGDILIELARSAGVDPMAAFGARSFYEYLRKRWGNALPSGATADTPAPGWESLLQVGGRWTGSSAAGRGATPATGYQSDVGGGVLEPTAAAGPAPGVAAPPAAVAALPTPAVGGSPGARPAEEVLLWAYPHIYFYDGRNANRRWLQEIPEPVTKCVWGSWAELHTSTARSLGISTNDIIEIAHGGVRIRLGAYVWDGVAPGVVAVPIGQGHRHYGRFATHIGANVLKLLNGENPPVKISVSGESRWLPRIRGSNKQHGREIVQTVFLGETFRREKAVIMPLPSGYGKNDFYPGHTHKLHRWAMAVDIDKCIGCNACVVACYAENNLATIGPEGVYRRREMAWLRIDTYRNWRSRSHPIDFQPMLCQHCDAAPCEPVCPVFAASHSDEGLNMQVYNRCVGTRYCENNCPYKVRRFNWYDYEWPPPLDWQLNPDVTVRRRGVMEKCTFCIQRIRQAEIVALRENRKLEDGEVTPACAQTCPTGVFAFGDLMDPNARVTKIVSHDPRAYQVLAELNTKPAVIYLKRIVG